MFARKYVMKVAASIIFSVSSFISLIFMTRYVGEAYGMMMWGMALVATFNGALDIGFHSANIKKVSEGLDINKCVSTYLAIRIAISVLTMSLVLLTSLLMGLLNGGFPAEFWIVTAVFIVYFSLNNLHWVMTGTFIGRMEAGKESIGLVTEYTVRSVSLIALAVTGATAAVLSTGYVIGMVCALTVSFLMFRPLKVRLVRPAFFKEYRSFVVPLAVPLILIAVVTYIDKVLIGAFHGEFEVGLYTAAAGVTYSFIALGTVMNGLLLSHMSKLEMKGERENARNTLWNAQKYLTVLMLPATVFLLVFGNETAVALFKEGFAGSGPVLSVLALGIYLTILTGMLSQALLSMNRNATYGRSAVIYAIITLLLFFVLIPGKLFDLPFGAVGAAYALVIGMFVFLFLLAISIRRLGAAGIYPRTYIHIAAAAAVLALMYCFKVFVAPSGVIPLVLLAVLCVAVYSAILVAVREISRNDIRFIRNALSPKELYGDLRDEMRGR